EPALQCMPVWPGFGLPVVGQEIEPVREGRRRVTFPRRGILAIEERRERDERGRGDDILAHVGAADPIAELRKRGDVGHAASYHVPPSARMRATVAFSLRVNSVTMLRSSLSWVF